ncbi:MAG TPA: hypothetical protein VEC60_17675 [Reyranella sp.]|nr:hypothetical protein [Reyranella sp.]
MQFLEPPHRRPDGDEVDALGGHQIEQELCGGDGPSNPSIDVPTETRRTVKISAPQEKARSRLPCILVAGILPEGVQCPPDREDATENLSNRR